MRSNFWGTLVVALAACGPVDHWAGSGARGKADDGDGKGTHRAFGLDVVDLDHVGDGKHEKIGKTRVIAREGDQTTVAAELLRFRAKDFPFRIDLEDRSADKRLRFWWIMGDPSSPDAHRVGWRKDAPSKLILSEFDLYGVNTDGKGSFFVLRYVRKVCREYEAGEVISHAFERVAVSEPYPVTETSKYEATVGLPCPEGALVDGHGVVERPEDDTFGLFVFPVDLPSSEANEDEPYEYTITVQLGGAVT